MAVFATEGTIMGTCIYQSDVMVLVGEVKMVSVSDCDGITSTRDGSLKETVGVSRTEQSGGPVSVVGVGVSGDRDDCKLGETPTVGGREVRGVDCAVL